MRMKYELVSQAKRKPINLSLDSQIVEAARELGLNISRISEQALRIATKKERERRWAAQHRERMDAFADWLDEHGMPFEDLRVF